MIGGGGGGGGGRQGFCELKGRRRDEPDQAMGHSGLKTD